MIVDCSNDSTGCTFENSGVIFLTGDFVFVGNAENDNIEWNGSNTYDSLSIDLAGGTSGFQTVDIRIQNTIDGTVDVFSSNSTGVDIVELSGAAGFQNNVTVDLGGGSNSFTFKAGCLTKH